MPERFQIPAWLAAFIVFFFSQVVAGAIAGFLLGIISGALGISSSLVEAHKWIARIFVFGGIWLSIFIFAWLSITLLRRRLGHGEEGRVIFYFLVYAIAYQFLAWIADAWSGTFSLSFTSIVLDGIAYAVTVSAIYLRLSRQSESRFS